MLSRTGSDLGAERAPKNSSGADGGRAFQGDLGSGKVLNFLLAGLIVSFIGLELPIVRREREAIYPSGSVPSPMRRRSVP